MASSTPTSKRASDRGWRIHALAAALLFAAALPAFAMDAFSADYTASYMGLQADGQMSVVAQPGNQWKYSLHIRNAMADLSQTTVFEDLNGQFRPVSGDDTANAIFKKKAVKSTFNWKTAQATWSGDVKPERRGPLKLEAGDMDALLINLAIARDVQAGKPLKYRMVEEGKARPMAYSIVGKEKITIGGKTREATKVVRVDDGDKELFAWVVDGVPVPVRILQREKGQDSLDLTIKSLR